VDDEVPWLTLEERATWVAFTLASNEVLAALDRRIQRVAGLAHSHFAILQVVSQAPEAVAKMADVSATLRFSPSRLSHAVGRLERDGWVERRADPDDGRGQLVALTEVGHQRIAEIAPDHIRAVRRLVFDHLTSEQVTQLATISRALIDGAAQD
jgi:DNA-binding MarR family transcriptional regulator